MTTKERLQELEDKRKSCTNEYMQSWHDDAFGHKYRQLAINQQAELEQAKTAAITELEQRMKAIPWRWFPEWMPEHGYWFAQIEDESNGFEGRISAPTLIELIEKAEELQNAN